ncbi:MAG TPA: hypothetical protein G4O02_04670 [Caldilineae bacterium]|nr:hypothetical protein [Caldilineae bacterium]
MSPPGQPRQEKRLRLQRMLADIGFEIDDAMRRKLEDNRRLLQQAWDLQPVDRTPVTAWSQVNGAEDPLRRRHDLVENVKPQLLGILQDLRNGYDRLAGVVRNFNTTLLASAFGCHIRIMENGQDWAEPVIQDIDQVASLKVPDLSHDGLLPEYLEDIAILRDVLPPEVTVGNRILLGPIDHIYWLRGANPLFIDMFDHPDAVHRMFSVVTEAHIQLLHASHEAARWSFTPDEVHFDTMVHAECKGLVMFSDDGSVNLSPELFAEFVAPYNRRLLEEFGGGLIHTCGACEHLLEEYAKLPATGVELNLRLVNYDKAREILEGKVIVTYGGLIPADSYEKSLRRTIEEARRGGLILTGIPPEVLQDLRERERKIAFEGWSPS